jgi:hypothetical protein
VQRQWSDSELADEDPISPGSVRERKRTGGVEGEEAKRRRESAPVGRRITAAQVLCSVGPMEESSRRRRGGRRRSGGKK